MLYFIWMTGDVPVVQGDAASKYLSTKGEKNVFNMQVFNI